jgi:hypothetical protein
MKRTRREDASTVHSICFRTRLEESGYMCRISQRLTGTEGVF